MCYLTNFASYFKNEVQYFLATMVLALPVLANPAGFSREVDLFTLAFNIILLQKSIQFRFYN